MSAPASPTPCPTGEQHDIAHGRYAATVTEVGGGLRTLTADGRPLLAGFSHDEVRPVYRGAVLAPWPNRIGDGRYSFDGATYQVPLNEPDRDTALHGLVAFAPWSLVAATESSVQLAHRLEASTGYPAPLDLQISYSLADDGLTIGLAATNAGDMPAPYGCSIHPYLTAGPGRVDDWSFEIAATDYLEVDPERLLPRGLRSVHGTAQDFRRRHAIGDVQLDHALTGIAWDTDGTAVAYVVDADGRGVALGWDRSCPWVQVHTADRPEPELDRAGLAVEPMTCPPDAFRSGTDLIVLRPGERHEVAWRVAAIP